MSNQWVNSEGWTFDYHDRAMDLFSIPSELVHDSSDFQIRLTHIAHSPGMTRRVWFVDRLDGRCLVTVHQAKSEIEAREAVERLRGES